MKKLLISLFLCIPFLVSGQSAADKLFDKYSGQEGFTSVYITKLMFAMFADMEHEDPEYDKLVNDLKSIKILATEEGNEQLNLNFYEEVMEMLPEDEYQELMIIKEKDQDIKFMVREVDGQIRELLLIAGGKNSNVLISIQGLIDLKTISKLSKSMKVDGLEHLDEIDKKKD